MLTDEDRPPRLRTAGDEPAFPVPSGYYQGHPGISAREWFAGMAMAGLLCGPAAQRTAAGSTAYHACAYADAMLAELGKAVPR